MFRLKSYDLFFLQQVTNQVAVAVDHALNYEIAQSVIVVFILFVKRLMHEGHSDRPLAHCGGDPFDIAAPDVADREHAGQTGFEEMGSSGERPMRGRQILL